MAPAHGSATPGGHRPAVTGWLARPALTFESVELQVSDLVLLGWISGAWPAFLADLRRGVTLERAHPGGVTLGALTERATAFRYEHGLISAAEFTAWLRARSLSIADLSGALRRAILRERDGGGAALAAPPEDALTAALVADAAVAGVLRALRSAAEARLGAAHELGWPAARRPARKPDGGDHTTLGFTAPPDALAAALADRVTGLTGLGRDELERRLLRLASCDAALAELRLRFDDDALLGPVFRDHGLDWLRLEGRRVRFEREGAAREFRLLVVADGMAPDAAAERAGAPLERLAIRVGDAPAAAQAELAAGAPGDLLGPWPVAEGWELALLDDKRRAEPADAELRRRAVDALIEDRLARILAGRVRRDAPL